jgi:hypothetical protein
MKLFHGYVEKRWIEHNHSEICLAAMVCKWLWVPNIRVLKPRQVGEASIDIEQADNLFWILNKVCLRQ